MSKSFLGIRVKALRESRAMTQVALAAALKLSPSYLNQIENNQRPLTVPVLLRLQAFFGLDLQNFSDDEASRQIAEVREASAAILGRQSVPMAEISALVQQMPGLAQVLLAWQRRSLQAEERLAALGALRDDDHFGDHFGDRHGRVTQAHEEVREFFYARHSHLALLDEHAEALAARIEEHAGDRAGRLEAYLSRAHGVRTVYAHADQRDQVTRRYDAASRTLTLFQGLQPSQRNFQVAIQLALLEVGALIDEFVLAQDFRSPEAQALARIGFANHHAGALLLPCGRFLAEAEALRYDIELLSERFDVSFETVCHRLSTLQRPQARGIPFFFVRVDRAGNISKRQSATDFHFSRAGGTCPLWNVYEAFARPGQVITQISRMPDGKTYLWIARTVSHQRGGYGAPRRDFAVALGCDVSHAGRIVYAQGLDLKNPDAATPIGAGCKVCDRTDCAQRAFPSLGTPLDIDENIRKFSPYANAGRAD